MLQVCVGPGDLWHSDHLLDGWVVLLSGRGQHLCGGHLLLVVEHLLLLLNTAGAVESIVNSLTPTSFHKLLLYFNNICATISRGFGVLGFWG